MAPLARHVPWKDWGEWLSVFRLLFCNDREQQKLGLEMVNTWRLKRAKLPIAVSSTADLIEVSYNSARSESEYSEQATKLMQAMAFVRAINGIVDEYQVGSYAQSIAGIANQVGLPKWLVDVRHEATHKGLPSLEVLTLGINTILDWLFERYWLAQVAAVAPAIPNEGHLDQVVHQLYLSVCDGSSAQSKPSTKEHMARKAFLTNRYHQLRVVELVSSSEEIIQSSELNIDALEDVADYVDYLQSICSPMSISSNLVPKLLATCCTTVWEVQPSDHQEMQMKFIGWERVLVSLAQHFDFLETLFLDTLCGKVTGQLNNFQSENLHMKPVTIAQSAWWCSYFLSERWCLLSGLHSDSEKIGKKVKNRDPATWTVDEKYTLSQVHSTTHRSKQRRSQTEAWVRRILVRVSQLGFSHQNALSMLRVAQYLIKYAKLAGDPKLKLLAMQCELGIESAKEENRKENVAEDIPYSEPEPWTKVKYWIPCPLGKVEIHERASSTIASSLAPRYSSILERVTFEKSREMNWHAETEDAWDHSKILKTAANVRTDL